MEPPILFYRCHFRGCDAELEEQRLGVLDQLRHCRHRGYRRHILRPSARPCARLAWHSGPGILGAGNDFLGNRSTNANQRCDSEFYAPPNSWAHCGHDQASYDVMAEFSKWLEAGEEIWPFVVAVKAGQRTPPEGLLQEKICRNIW
jgi:hypothetical protein